MSRILPRPLWKHTVALGLLLALSIVVKAAVWQLPPQIFNDSAGYLVPALSLLGGRGYGVQENGFRTPTYPLFLTIALAPSGPTPLSACRDAHATTCLGKSAQTAQGESALRMVVAVQIALGLLTTTLLFALGLRLTRNTLVAFLFGAGYALNLATAFWEISILTETLTTFLVTLAVYLTLHADKGRALVRLALGITLGVLALCHQLYIAYWILPVAFLLVLDLKSTLVHPNSDANTHTVIPVFKSAFMDRERGSRGRVHPHPLQVVPVLVIPLLAVVAWSTYNYSVNGYFTPSTLSGYVLIQMVAPVIENAPPGYDGITQTYIGYRNAMITETGSYSGAIFRGWKAIMNQTGLTWSELSRRLTGLSLFLIAAYPSSYLGVVRVGWSRFWDFAFYHFEAVPVGAPQLIAWFTDPGWQAGLTLLFWLAQVVLLVLWLMARRAHKPSWPITLFLFILLTIWMSAGIVALTNYQDNARMHTYILPLQYGTIVFMIWAVITMNQ